MRKTTFKFYLIVVLVTVHRSRTTLIKFTYLRQTYVFMYNSRTSTQLMSYFYLTTLLFMLSIRQGYFLLNCFCTKLVIYNNAL